MCSQKFEFQPTWKEVNLWMHGQLSLIIWSDYGASLVTLPTCNCYYYYLSKSLNIVLEVVSAHTLDTVCSVFVYQVSACTCVRICAFESQALDTACSVFVCQVSACTCVRVRTFAAHTLHTVCSVFFYQMPVMCWQKSPIIWCLPSLMGMDFHKALYINGY